MSILFNSRVTLSRCNQTEPIQNKRRRCITFKCNIIRAPHSGYENIVQLLNLKTLQDRRCNSHAMFLEELLKY